MLRILGVLLCLAMTACGGGGGGGGGPGSAASGFSGSGVITGVAAVGAAIQGRIYLIDASGQDRYFDTTDGNFSFNLNGLRPPVLLKAQWIDSAGAHRLYSFASANGVANITPLTHLALGAAAGTAALDGLYNAPSLATFNAVKNALPTAIANLQTALMPLLARHAVSGANPITSPFAADHTGMDALLDTLTVQYSGDTVTLTDKASGTLLLQAPLAHIAAALSVSNWGVADAAAAHDTHAAINSAGVGMVTWTEVINGTSVLKARLMDGVDSGVTLSAADTGHPRVAFDGLGNALAVWVQAASGRNEIWSSRYDASTRLWSAAHRLSAFTAAGAASQPDLAVDTAGNAWLVWTQANASVNHFDGFGARYSAATNSWTSATLLTDGVNTAYGLRVAVNGTGQGLVAWQQQRGDGSSNNSQPVDIWTRSVDTLAQPGQAIPVNTDSNGAALAAYVYAQLSVAVNASGSAAVAWSQKLQPIQPMTVQAALYVPGSGWRAEATISANNTDDCYSPQIALDAAGNARAVWQQQTLAGAYGGTNRYVAGSGWDVAGFFVDSRGGDTFAPSLAMDPAGNASVAWYRWSGGNVVDLMVNRQMQGSGWSGAQLVSTLGAYSSMLSTQPRLSANSDGQTLLVWGASAAATSGI